MNIEELALKRFGVRNQIIKTIEELGELQTALARYLLYKDETYELDVIDELADVQVMLNQLWHVFPEADDRLYTKVSRLTDILMEKEEYREMRENGDLQVAE